MENILKLKEEKKALRTISNKIGFAYCLTIISYVLITLLISNNKATYSLLLLIQSLCFFLIFFLLIKLCPAESKYITLFKKPKKHFVPYIIIGFPICFFAEFITSTVSEFLKKNNIYSTQPSMLNQSNLLFFIVISAPIVEEFVFRGVILGLLKRYGDRFAIFISAILFGLIHANIEQFIYAFLIGLYFGFVLVKTKSLWTTILLHSLFNSSSALNVFFKDNSFVIAFNIFQVIITLLAIYLFFHYRKIDSNFFSFSSLSNNKTSLNLSKRLISFIFTPGMILMLIYIIYSFISLGRIES